MWSRRDLGRFAFTGLPAAFGAQRFAAAQRRGGDGSVKITRFSLHKVSHRWRDLLFLEIHTDAGLTGIGEGSLHTRTETVEATLRWLEHQLTGLDPAGPEDHWDRIYYRLSRQRSGMALISALSAVDIALWDIEGKRLGVPVWRLLGGPIHRQLRVYYTHWNNTMTVRTPEAFAQRAVETRDKGWTAVKWAIPRLTPEHARIRDTVQTLEAIRNAVGTDLDLGLELWESLTPRSAVAFADAVAPYKPMFIEEPVQREFDEEFAKLAARSPVPIATGEGLHGRHEFRRLLETGGAAIIQPDVIHCGGMMELRKIANMAEPYGVEIAPHQCFGPVAHVASLHAMSVCRNFFVQEWEADDDAYFSELTAGKYPVQKNGVVTLPDGPGLGIEVDFAAFVKKFPYTLRKPTALPSATRPAESSK
jgi:galactonate dehydratase